jgi:hypothetical protein
MCLFADGAHKYADSIALLSSDWSDLHGARFYPFSASGMAHWPHAASL